MLVTFITFQQPHCHLRKQMELIKYYDNPLRPGIKHLHKFSSQSISFILDTLSVENYISNKHVAVGIV